jgi:hypothetical protein
LKSILDNIDSGFNYIIARFQIREDKEVLLKNRLKLTLAKFVTLRHASCRKKYLFDSRNQA